MEGKAWTAEVDIINVDKMQKHSQNVPFYISAYIATVIFIKKLKGEFDITLCKSSLLSIP